MRSKVLLAKCVASVLVVGFSGTVWFRTNVLGPIAVYSDDTIYVVRGIPDGMVESNPSSIDFGVLGSYSQDEHQCAVNVRINPDYWPVNPEKFLSVRPSHPTFRIETTWINNYAVRITAYFQGSLGSLESPHESKVILSRIDDPSFEFAIPVTAVILDPSPKSINGR